MKKIIMYAVLPMIALTIFQACGKDGNNGNPEPETVIPEAPGDPSYSAAGNSVTVSWTQGANAEGYELNFGGKSYTTEKLSYTFEDLEYEKLYACKVRSIRQEQVSIWKSVEFKLYPSTNRWVGQWTSTAVSATASAGEFSFPLDLLLQGTEGALPEVGITIANKEDNPGYIYLTITDLDSYIPIPEETLTAVPLKVSGSTAKASIAINQNMNYTLPEPIVIGKIPGFDLIIDAIVANAGILGGIISEMLASAELKGISLTIKKVNVSCTETSVGAEATLALDATGTLRLNTSLDDTDIPILGNAGDMINNMIGSLALNAEMEIEKSL